ncbi:MAG: hypothetical protein ACKOCO_05490 [Bacteroidota bacterium]
MKYLLFLLSLAACTNEPPTLPLPPRRPVQEEPPPPVKVPEKKVTEAVPMETRKVPEASGDYDGDGRTETVRMTRPKDFGDSSGNLFDEDKLVVTIAFPGSELPTISIKESVTVYLVNEGDLDGDGADELGVVPGRGYGIWSWYHLYTFKKGQWSKLIYPFRVHFDDLRDDFDFVKKHPKIAGSLIITHTVLDENANTSLETEVVKY